MAALIVVVLLALGADLVASGATELAPISGMILGFIPALIWLVLFYQLDRQEPEPRRLVVGVFALGALLAAAIGIPLVGSFFRVSDWLGTSTLVQVVGSILVIGFTQETLKFLAFRLSVYDSSEFDEMTDGVIYGIAAGLGYAAVLCMNLVIESGGIALGVGAITVTVVALAHGSLGGLVGFFAAGQKFQRRPVWWTAAGLALAAVLNGLLLTIRSIISPGDAQRKVRRAADDQKRILHAQSFAGVAGARRRARPRDRRPGIGFCAEGERRRQFDRGHARRRQLAGAAGLDQHCRRWRAGLRGHQSKR
jgi:RsiW-degrading membrane proteinase PrsW (M82 family)